ICGAVDVSAPAASLITLPSATARQQQHRAWCRARRLLGRADQGIRCPQRNPVSSWLTYARSIVCTTGWRGGNGQRGRCMPERSPWPSQTNGVIERLFGTLKYEHLYRAPIDKGGVLAV